MLKENEAHLFVNDGVLCLYFSNAFQVCCSMVLGYVMRRLCDAAYMQMALLSYNEVCI